MSTESRSAPTLKVLRLGNSADFAGDTPPAGRSYALAAQVLAAKTGAGVDTVVKIIWPAPRLPQVIDRWLEQEKPDLVELVVPTFWYTYRSVPLMFERRLGRVGHQVARAGFRAASTPWMANRQAFRLLRRALLRTIGGATYFQPAEVLEHMTACIQQILRHEEAVPLVACPFGVSGSEGVSPRWRAEAERRRRAVDSGLRSLCASLHIEYLGRETVTPGDPRDGVGPDRVHLGVAGHQAQGEWEGRALAAAWSRARGLPALRPGTRSAAPSRVQRSGA